MKHQYYSILTVLALLIVSGGCAKELPVSEAKWLHGTWKLTYDPDDSIPDYLIFKQNGTVINRAPGLHDIEGRYKVFEKKIVVFFDIKGKTFSMDFSFMEDKSKLFLYSERTGNTSEYSKQ